MALAVAIAAVLAYKQPLHGLVSRLDREDVYAGVRLLAATFIVLPLLPDRTIDPWGALNPHKLWLLVLLISGLSLVGYVAMRLLGPNRGIPLTGLTGGLVSSTAVTLSFARQSREKGEEKSAPALRLRHADRVGRDVPARPGNGADRQSRTSPPARRPLPGHGGRDRRLRVVDVPACGEARSVRQGTPCEPVQPDLGHKVRGTLRAGLAARGARAAALSARGCLRRRGARRHDRRRRDHAVDGGSCAPGRGRYRGARDRHRRAHEYASSRR